MLPVGQVTPDQGWAEWLRWAIDGSVATISALVGGIATGAYFVGSTRRQLDVLSAQMANEIEARSAMHDDNIASREELRDELNKRIDASDERLHAEIRRAVHDLKNDMTKTIAEAVATMSRVETRIQDHLNRQDDRLDRLIERLSNDRGKQ